MRTDGAEREECARKTGICSEPLGLLLSSRASEVIGSGVIFSGHYELATALKYTSGGCARSGPVHEPTFHPINHAVRGATTEGVAKEQNQTESGQSFGSPPTLRQ